MSWSGSRYDEVAVPQTRWGSEVAQRLMSAIAARPMPTVLDAGCGTGRLSEEMLDARSDLSVIAGDNSSDMLQRAKQRLARFGARATTVTFDLSPGVPLPAEAPQGVDAVFSTGTFHWVREQAAMYVRLAQLIRPGGALVAQCGGAGSIAEVRGALDELGIEWRLFNHYADAAETAAWLRQAGFVDVWTWLTPEAVVFDSPGELTNFLRGGALSPYLAHLDDRSSTQVVSEVAKRLATPRLDFVRLNILARRTSGA